MPRVVCSRMVDPIEVFPLGSDTLGSVGRGVAGHITEEEDRILDCILSVWDSQTRTF